MTESLLRTEGLTKRFDEFTAVDHVDIAVERGEFRSVIGPNGAGKTTLFDLITGTVAPSDGAVYLDGTEITELSPQERVRRGLSRSFQITNVFDGLTVRENVRLAVQSTMQSDFGTRGAFLEDKDSFPRINATAEEVLSNIGLADREEAVAATLAYGDRRLLELGIVLATDPAVVLLDEPTAGMSDAETDATMGLIEEVLADRSLVLIEHDIDVVMGLSDSITVLAHGEEVTTGPPEEVAEDRAVQEVYLGGVSR